MEEKTIKHPLLKMSKQREQVWLTEATDDDFFGMVDLLAALYAKKKYNDTWQREQKLHYDPKIFFTDYGKRKVTN